MAEPGDVGVRVGKQDGHASPHNVSSNYHSFVMPHVCSHERSADIIMYRIVTLIGLHLIRNERQSHITKYMLL
jgi:hypothetical protein